LALFIAWFAPAERTLGDLVKLIYVHAAISWVAILIFVIAAILGLSFLVTTKSSLYEWSCALEVTAIFLWFIHTLMGAAAMRIVWGGFLWTEPKFKTTVFILLITLAAYLFSMVVAKPKIVSVLNVGIAPLVVLLVLRAGRIVHPLNPILASSGLKIKICSGMIALLFLAIALQIARWLREFGRSILPY